MSKLAPRLVVAASLALLTGCVKEVQQGDTTLFVYDWWPPVSLILGGVALIVGGLLLRKRGLWAWIAVVGGLVLVAVISPNLFFEKVTVSPRGATSRVGFYFAPTDASITFADTKSVALTKEVTRGRRGRKNVSYKLTCAMTNGTTQVFPVGTLMQEGGAEAFVVAARAAGVPVIDQTGD